MNLRVMAAGPGCRCFFPCGQQRTGAFALSGADAGTPSNTTIRPASNALEIKFAYSSEKKPWIEPAQFNK